MTQREKIVDVARSQLDKPYSSMGNMFNGDKGWGCAQLVAACYNKVLGTEFVGSCYDFAGDIAFRTPNQGYKFTRTSTPIAGDVVLYYINNNTNDNYNCGHAAMYVGSGRVIGAYGQKVYGQAGNWGSVRETPVTGQQLGGAIVYARCRLLDDTTSGFAGEYTVDVDCLNVRDAPNLKGNIVAQYKKFARVRLDDWRESNDGYIWGRYVGASSGKYRYVAIGPDTGTNSVDDYLIKC